MLRPWLGFALFGLSFTTPLASVHATTYVVDSTGAPGSHFTDIVQAIDAAQNGDVLLVLAGHYDGFTLRKALTIIGRESAIIDGRVIISQLWLDKTTVLAGLSMPDLFVYLCNGHLILDQISDLQRGFVVEAEDFRLHRTRIEARAGTASTALGLINAYGGEIVDCTLIGGSPADTSLPVQGGYGLMIDTSALHLVRSSCRGGHGSGSGDFISGGGGTGIFLAFDTELVLAGGGVSEITGGRGGDNGAHPGCSHDGWGGFAIGAFSQATLWLSGAQFVSAGYMYGDNCVQIQPGWPIPGTVHEVMPADPTLFIEAGVPIAGGRVSLKLDGPPSSTATLWFGRTPIAVDDGHARIDLLVPKTRIVDLGVLPANGQASFVVDLATSLSPGDLLLAQAEVVLPGGEIRRTNSVPLIVR